MITHLAIAKKFAAGESVEDIAVYARAWDRKRLVPLSQKYIEHALRQVMIRQHIKFYGRRGKPTDYKLDE